MRNLLLLPLAALFVFGVACGGDDAADGDGTAAPATTATTAPLALAGETMILATTTSTQDSGLLDVLVPMFEKQTGAKVQVIAVGTGAALEMGGKGDADVVLSHALTSEKTYVEKGDLVNGKLIMHNDFVLVGPANDPAGVKGAASLSAAMTAVAGKGPFVSRGDKSGTHTKELALWKAAGVEVASVKQREETGQGMGATLNVASQKGAYTLTDRATYLAQKRSLSLQVLYEGDANLLNIYHAYVVNPAKHRKVKAEAAAAFVSFLVADGTQKVIGEFGKDKFGEPLFFPDAGKTVESLGAK